MPYRLNLQKNKTFQQTIAQEQTENLAMHQTSSSTVIGYKNYHGQANGSSCDSLQHTADSSADAGGDSRYQYPAATSFGICISTARRFIIPSPQTYPNLYILNGLGSRRLTTAPAFCQKVHCKSDLP